MVSIYTAADKHIVPIFRILTRLGEAYLYMMQAWMSSEWVAWILLATSPALANRVLDRRFEVMVVFI